MTGVHIFFDIGKIEIRQANLELACCIDMKQTLEFLRRLAANNDRDRFNAHKDEYLQVKAYVESFTQQLIDVVSELEPDGAALTPADCLYRIYRDTRFSSDKTPYKTHIGIYVNPHGGKKSEFAAIISTSNPATVS